MRPAFSSTWSAGAFALLLGVTMSLPALVAKTSWLDRRDVYPTIPLKYGPFPFTQEKIFDETSDADIVIMGSSRIWTAINTPYLKHMLSEKLGREANVFTIGWPWPGFDASYVIARDLLAHRHVRMLVISNEDLGPDDPHLHSARWFRVGENSEMLAGLPMRVKARYYASAVLGMPRHLLSLVRKNRLEDPLHCHQNFWNTYYRAPNIAESDGSLRARLAYGSIYAVFNEFHPHGSATPADALIYSDDTRDSFTFTAPHSQPYQLFFARKLARLCEEQGTRLVVLHTPFLSEQGKAVISEHENWPEALGAPVSLVGIPPTKLFARIAADDLPKLFYEDAHLNQNGQELFTPLITPVLLKLYGTPNK